MYVRIASAFSSQVSTGGACELKTFLAFVKLSLCSSYGSITCHQCALGMHSSTDSAPNNAFLARLFRPARFGIRMQKDYKRHTLSQPGSSTTERVAYNVRARLRGLVGLLRASGQPVEDRPMPHWSEHLLTTD